MKYFILAGEASGDKQAALLCEALIGIDPDADIRGWGGEAMSEKGVQVTRHFRELAYMGFVEVIRHLPAIFKNFRLCKEEIMTFRPDGLILVDYPGFNLRMASWAYKNSIPVYYYISPQLWAWHTSRVYKIKEAVRRMYVILPFEKAFYKKFDVDAVYIGHPLALSTNEKGIKPESYTKNVIALLPGSRKSEVELILPEMIGLAKLLPEFSFRVIAVQHLPISLYETIIRDQANVRLIEGNMQEVLRESEAAVVTSGTATLETALSGTPQIVVYKGNSISYMLVKRMLKIPFISLVNLIIGKKLVPELIQDDCHPKKLREELIHILTPENRISISEGYREIYALLTDGGGPPIAAADIISDLGNANKVHGKI